MLITPISTCFSVVKLCRRIGSLNDPFGALRAFSTSSLDDCLLVKLSCQMAQLCHLPTPKDLLLKSDAQVKQTLKVILGFNGNVGEFVIGLLTVFGSIDDGEAV